MIGFVKILVNQQHVPEFDYSIATPLMNILCLFELKFKETALGNDIIDVRRKSGGIVRWDIDLLDLTSLHWTLLVGSTFPPERRDGLLRTLGPLTLAITLIMEKENQNLVKDAFCEAINYLGDSKKLANWFAKVTDAELGNTLAMLGKIILLNSYVNQNDIKANFLTFPLLAFLVAYKQDRSVVNSFDFSGPGAHHCYATIAKYTYSMKTKETDQNKIKQSIFHGIFGSAYANLGILAEVTDNKFWFNRIELNDTYTNGELRTIQGLPLITKYSSLVHPCSQIQLTAASKLHSPRECENVSLTMHEVKHCLNKNFETLMATMIKMMNESSTFKLCSSKSYGAIVWNDKKQKYEYSVELDSIAEGTNELFYNPRT